MGNKKMMGKLKKKKNQQQSSLKVTRNEEHLGHFIILSSHIPLKKVRDLERSHL